MRAVAQHFRQEKRLCREKRVQYQTECQYHCNTFHVTKTPSEPWWYIYKHFLNSKLRHRRSKIQRTNVFDFWKALWPRTVNGTDELTNFNAAWIGNKAGPDVALSKAKFRCIKIIRNVVNDNSKKRLKFKSVDSWQRSKLMAHAFQRDSISDQRRHHDKRALLQTFQSVRIKSLMQNTK